MPAGKAPRLVVHVVIHALVGCNFDPSRGPRDLTQSVGFAPFALCVLDNLVDLQRA